MSRSLLLCILFAIGQIAVGQPGPAISVGGSETKYPSKAKSISSANFNELTVTVDSNSFRLHNGLYLKKFKPTGLSQLRLINHWLIGDSNGTPAYALLHLEHLGVGGSSSFTSFIQVMSLSNHALRVHQEFRFIPLAADGQPTVEFNPSKGILIISAHSDDDSSDCCPKSIDVASYRWDGAKFNLTEWHTVPYKQTQ